jgi:hypothetical protein
MDRATRISWKTLAAPEKRERLDIPDIFFDVTGDRMRDGHVPVDMDDRWFIYFQDGWLHFHRSWTGAHIFALRLDGCSAGVCVIDGWVNREPDQYRSPGVEQDRATVVGLIHSYFGK